MCSISAEGRRGTLVSDDEPNHGRRCQKRGFRCETIQRPERSSFSNHRVEREGDCQRQCDPWEMPYRRDLQRHASECQRDCGKLPAAVLFAEPQRTK